MSRAKSMPLAFQLFAWMATFTSVGLALFATPASAQVPRLQGLSDSERAAILPLLERGTVALIESNANGSFKQASVATIVRAPAASIFQLISNPELYPSFMPSVSEVEIKDRRENVLAYEWTWEGVLFDLHGTNTLTLYPSRRIDVEATSGDLGRGKFRWDFVPLDESRTIVIHTLHVNMRQANYVTRQLVDSDPSMMHAMNLSTGLVLLMGAKTKVEHLAGTGDGRRPSGGVSGSGDLGQVMSLASPALLPLFARGELALWQMDGRGRLRQGTVFGKASGSPDTARGLLVDPARYPQIIPTVESAEVTSRSDTEIAFDYELGFPVINIEGKMKLRRSPDGRLLYEAPEGDLEGGRWAWEFGAVSGQTVIAYSVRANLARANWLLSRLIAREPFFLHGISCASNLVAVRAIQARLR